MSEDHGQPLPDFYDNLDGSLEHALRLLERGAADRKSAFHQATVATVARDGSPAARTVVLRGVERRGPSIRFHTDARSRKVDELRREPRIAVHFYDHGKKIQLRLRGRAELEGRAGLADEVWSGMRTMSKACYRQPVAPGARIGDPAAVDAAEPLPDADGFGNFVPVLVRVETIEWLYLAARGHRRALFSFRDGGGPSATWLAP